MIKPSIRKHKPSTSEEYKNPISFDSDQSVTLLKKHNQNLSNQSLQSQVTQSPLSPTLFNEKQKKDNKGQIQLKSQKNDQIKSYKETALENHRIRKLTESQHNKAINQFYKRKQQIARIMKSQDKMKLKKNQIFNKFQSSSKNKGNIEKKSFHSFQSRDTINSTFQNNRLAEFMRSSKIVNNQKILAQLTQPYLSSAINLRNVSHYKQNILRTPFQKMSRRQVYLSNISNLEELRHSISHSRAKFNKKHIKMLREIGKYYIPFEDRLIGHENDVKGIFL